MSNGLEELIGCVENLNRLSVKRKIDISKEINIIKGKIRAFGKTANDQNNPKPAPTKNKRKRRNPRKESSKKTLPRHKTINFKCSSRLIKGISICHVCDTTHLECREYKSFFGTKVTCCTYCAEWQRAMFAKHIENASLNEDAMTLVITGSFKSGKYSR